MKYSSSTINLTLFDHKQNFIHQLDIINNLNNKIKNIIENKGIHMKIIKKILQLASQNCRTVAVVELSRSL